jgi:hypothetical protein
MKNLVKIIILLTTFIFTQACDNGKTTTENQTKGTAATQDQTKDNTDVESVPPIVSPIVKETIVNNVMNTMRLYLESLNYSMKFEKSDGKKKRDYKIKDSCKNAIKTIGVFEELLIKQKVTKNKNLLIGISCDDDDNTIVVFDIKNNINKNTNEYHQFEKKVQQYNARKDIDKKKKIILNKKPKDKVDSGAVAAQTYDVMQIIIDSEKLPGANLCANVKATMNNQTGAADLKYKDSVTCYSITEAKKGKLKTVTN